jgi:hypothetical protein
VGALAVVVAPIALQVEAEAGLLGDQVAGEGRLPALLQDGLLDPLHAPIGLGPTGPDEALAGARLVTVCRKVAERNSLALSLMTRSSFQPRAARSAATVRASWLVQVAEDCAD